MPDPKNYKTEDDWMGACVPRMVDEGKPQDQAVAACLNMWRERSKERGEGQGTGGERQEDGGTEACVCPECGTEVEHEKGTPCAEMTCPKCGGKMEGKELSEKAVWTTAYINNLPDSAFLYVESGDKDSEGKTVPRSKRHFPYKDAGGKIDLAHLRNAIQRIPQSNAPGLSAEKKRSLQERARRLLNRQKKSLFDKAVDWLKEAFGSEEAAPPLHPFMVWKEDNGQYRWLAIYSNKFRDEDDPPEILAEQAHKDFVAAVDGGEWPMPELWLWHVGATKSGAADWVAYDDSGFALASGVFDEGKEEVAARLATHDDLLTSHGMPALEIRRDTDDPTIITRYRTREISPLPPWAAANKHGTGFTILKEADMTLPARKRPFLENIMGKEGVASLEEHLAGKAKELEDEGIEFKEGEQPEDEAPEQEQPAAEAPEADKEGEEAPAPDAEPAPGVEDATGPQFVTHEELEEVFGGYVGPLVQAVRDLGTQMQAMSKELAAQKERTEALTADDEAKAKALLAQTPAASLFARVGRAVGADEALVDGRTSLAKSKPEEAKPDPADGPTYVPFLNEIMAGQYGRGD